MQFCQYCGPGIQIRVKVGQGGVQFIISPFHLGILSKIHFGKRGLEID